MTIRSLADAADAHAAGRTWTGYLRRGAPAQVAGQWTDLSYGAGIPVANYYASTPLTAALLNGAEGISVGPDCNAGGFKKYLQKAMMMPPATSIGQATLYALDVVMYYPFVDGDGGAQPMVNGVAIPRYDGLGCRVMAVGQGAGTALGLATLDYTNSDGVAGRSSGAITLAGTAGAGVLWTNGVAGTAGVYSAPFFPLQNGDRGVSSIEGIDIPAGIGGIFALVIVKPLGLISILEATTNPHEIDFLRERAQLHEIEDGAYLSMICRATTSASPTTLHAELTTVWG